MFDFHLHSTVSFDAQDCALDMALAAKAKGLKEICFTDHKDYDPLGKMPDMAFHEEDYIKAYDNLSVDGLVIRKGMEFGMAVDNHAQFAKDLAVRNYDFVLGSVHFAQKLDVYLEEYWRDKTLFQAERVYLEETLKCVQSHDSFDVLAHLNFVSKGDANKYRTNLRYSDHQEIVDEILNVLIAKGKGLELNTSGVDRCGGYLPEAPILQRFHDLGGRIVTIGSDAHNTARVGQYSQEACRLLKDIFGHVCTFANREPIFHKL